MPDDGLEQRLRSYLRRYVSYPPPVIDVTRRTRRVRGFVGSVVGSAVVVGALVLAFAVGHPLHSSSTAPGNSRVPTLSPASTPSGVIPWKPLAAGPVIPQPTIDPTAVAPAVPPGTPPCKASQLEGIQRYAGGYAQNSVFPVDVRNRSTTACYLEGWSAVSALDSAGHIVVVAVQGDSPLGNLPTIPIYMAVGTPPLAPDVISGYNGAPPAASHPLGQARIDVTWRHDCPNPATSRLAIDLSSGGGRLLVPYPLGASSGVGAVSGAPCQFTASPVEAGTWFPDGLPWPPQPPPEVGIEASLTSPSTARRGAAFDYEVTLTNVGSIPYNLDQCPNYIEYVGVGKGAGNFETFQLNCSSIRVIGPGASVTFEMRLDVPATEVPGATDLQWILQDGRVGSQVADATITLTG